jgi:ABC-type Mn2+/Zn2+ transport system ATPase subunit
MKIKYTPNLNWRLPAPKLAGEKSYLSLSGNNWNDFGVLSKLNSTLVIDGAVQPVEFSLKVLITDCDYTANRLDELCAAGWNGEFPIPNVDYVSVPTDVDFYKILQSKLDESASQKVLLNLRDAGYLINVIRDDAAKVLSDVSAFSSSLLRDSGSNKSFQDGWRLFVGQESQIRDFTLNILTTEYDSKPIPFRFESGLLPYDVNVLIGPNGIGKSYCLRSLVEYWLKTGMGDKKTLDGLGHEPFDVRPNINRLILVSYSPFEEFSLGLTTEDKVSDKTSYRYFGFRQKRENDSKRINQKKGQNGRIRINLTKPKGERVRINRNLPKFEASHSLIDAIFEDEKYKGESWWVNKFAAVESALKVALDFDHLAIKVNMDKAGGILDGFPSIINGEDYLELNGLIGAKYEKAVFKSICNFTDGIQFIKDNKVKGLSSGQQLFSYIAINVVGAIREHSLIVIDEPELFLHPTLEIEFISLLKVILKPFKSKAILATHSLAVVREVPSKCVHIFRNEGSGLEIVPPPFETFGGSVQRISSYVFGDKSVSKPFDEWVEQQMKDNPDAEKLISDLGDEINEELMMKILSLGRQYRGR